MNKLHYIKRMFAFSLAALLFTFSVTGNLIEGYAQERTMSILTCVEDHEHTSECYLEYNPFTKNYNRDGNTSQLSDDQRNEIQSVWDESMQLVEDSKSYASDNINLLSNPEVDNRDDLTDPAFNSLPFNQNIYSYNTGGMNYSWGDKDLSTPEATDSTQVSIFRKNSKQYDSALHKMVRNWKAAGWSEKTGVQEDTVDTRTYEYNLNYEAKEGAANVTLMDTIEYAQGNYSIGDLSVYVNMSDLTLSGEAIGDSKLSTSSTYEYELPFSSQSWTPTITITNNYPVATNVSLALEGKETGVNGEGLSNPRTYEWSGELSNIDAGAASKITVDTPISFRGSYKLTVSVNGKATVYNINVKFSMTGDVTVELVTRSGVLNISDENEVVEISDTVQNKVYEEIPLFSVSHTYPDAEDIQVIVLSTEYNTSGYQVPCNPSSFGMWMYPDTFYDSCSFGVTVKLKYKNTVLFEKTYTIKLTVDNKRIMLTDTSDNVYYWCSDSEDITNFNKNTIFPLDSNTLKTITVLDSTRNINISEYFTGGLHYGAFEFCNALTKLIFNNTGNVDISGYSYGAFYGCDALATVIFNNGGTVDISGGYNYGAFHNCNALITVIFNNGGNVDISGGDNSFGGAFNGCDALTTLIFNNTGNVDINGSGGGSGVFYDCTALATVIFNNKGAVNISGGSYVSYSGAFCSCDTLTTVIFNNRGTVNISGGSNSSSSVSGAFSFCKSLTTVIFNNTGAVNISGGSGRKSGAFYRCDFLTTVIFNNGGTVDISGGTTDGGAFFNCAALTKLISNGNVNIQFHSPQDPITIETQSLTNINRTIYMCQVYSPDVPPSQLKSLSLIMSNTSVGAATNDTKADINAYCNYFNETIIHKLGISGRMNAVSNTYSRSRARVSHAEERSSNLMESQWWGTLQSIDVSSITDQGYTPIVYVSNEYTISDYSSLLETWGPTSGTFFVSEEDIEYDDWYTKNKNQDAYYRNLEWYIDNDNAPDGFRYISPESYSSTSELQGVKALIIHIEKFPEPGKLYEPYSVQEGTKFNVILKMLAPAEAPVGIQPTFNEFYSNELTTSLGFKGIDDISGEYDINNVKSRITPSNVTEVWYGAEFEPEIIETTMPFVGGKGWHSEYTMAVILIATGIMFKKRKRKTRV